jgi:hypothetical protein
VGIRGRHAGLASELAIKEELAAGGTTQPGAYELYEEGIGYLKRFNLEDVDRAIGLFNAALSKDPSYTLGI